MSEDAETFDVTAHWVDSIPGGLTDGWVSAVSDILAEIDAHYATKDEPGERLAGCAIALRVAIAALERASNGAIRSNALADLMMHSQARSEGKKSELFNVERPAHHPGKTLFRALAQGRAAACVELLHKRFGMKEAAAKSFVAKNFRQVFGGQAPPTTSIGTWRRDASSNPDFLEGAEREMALAYQHLIKVAEEALPLAAARRGRAAATLQDMKEITKIVGNGRSVRGL